MKERMPHPQKIGLRPADFFHQVAKNSTPPHLLEQIYFLTTPLPTRVNIFLTHIPYSRQFIFALFPYSKFALNPFKMSLLSSLRCRRFRFGIETSLQFD